MVSAFIIALIAIPVYWIYSNISGLLKNIAAAKRSGLPYVIAPFSVYKVIWLLTHKFWLPIIKKFPDSWTEGFDYVEPDWVWTLLFEPFKKHGDIFLTVCPGRIYIWSANAEANLQICSRREAFPKALESYAILEIFGRNIITTEGIQWKQHRKVSAPTFNEKNNALVFAEACSQAQGMLKNWLSGDESGNKTIKEVQEDTLRLTLYIISSIGFGVRLLWPGQKPVENPSAKDAVYSSNEPPEGHTMSFEDALTVMLDRMIMVLIIPKWLLKHAPFETARKAYESYINWSQYMNELFAQKIEEARNGQQTKGMDIMGSLVKSAYGEPAKDGRKPSPGRAEKGEIGKPVLSDSDILGNAFVMIVAGHETTASSTHFSIMELAINPRTQRLVQKEVETVFGDETPEKWDYDSNINALLGGIVGAVLNEQLRIMPPVIAIPKSVSKAQDQVIVLDGKKYTLPAGANLTLNAIGVHRNPKYWPAQPSKITGKADDLDDFRPERWLVKVGADGTREIESATESEEDEDFGGYTGRDTHAKLFRPVRGSYIPFSEGARSCLGRRLAQVKVMAVLATIFQKYSVELAVDEWASDEEVAKMSVEKRKKLYKRAQDKARETIRGASTVITLKLHPGFIPVRVVKKGEERFVNIVD